MTTKYSEEANRLFPYLLPKIQKAIPPQRNGNGNGNGGGGSPSTPEISFFDLTDVDASGWDNGEVPTWDVTTSTFKPTLPTGGGGPTYVEGDGIDISGTLISALAHPTRGIIVDSGGIGVFGNPAGGLAADVDGLYIHTKPQSGLVIDSGGIGVGAGDGIEVSGDITRVYVPDLLGLGIEDDGANNFAVKRQSNSGLDLDGTGLAVDKAAAFVWTGQHQWNVSPHVNANLEFIGGDRVITASSDLTFTPADDLILTSTKTFRSSDYQDGLPIFGFSNHINSINNRQLTINSIKTDEFHTRLFVADTVRIDIGEEYWGKSMGIVHTNFTTPAIGASIPILVEDSPLMTAGVFENGDWVLIRYLNGDPLAGAEFAFGSVWGQVSSYVDMGDDAEGRGHQQWTFTFRQGNVGQLIEAGNIIVDFGASGQGYVHLSTLIDAQGPWIQIGEWNGANPYTPGNRTIGTQIGNLDAISDTDLNPGGYGLYSDNAYLRGMVRTAETIMDDDGLSLLLPTVASSTDIGAHAQLAWWDDLDDRSGTPGARIASWFDSISDSSLMHVKAYSSTDDAWIYLDADGGAGAAFISLHSEDGLEAHADTFNFVSVYGGLTINASGVDMAASSTARLRLLPAGAGTLEARGDLIPESDVTFDLGSGVKRWGTIYADDMIISGSISGVTLSGAEWQHSTSMVIDANSTSNTTVTITNQGSGRADLSVDRNIIVGGTVDGIDISAHAADAAAHHALATAGNGIAVSGQVVSVDLHATPGLAFSGGDLYVLNYHGITRDANGISVNIKTTSGLVVDSAGLAVGAGDGIDVGATTIAVDVTDFIDTAMGLTETSNNIQIDLATNSGLGFVSGDLAVGAGDGIDVVTGTVAVDVTDIIDTSFGLTESANNIQIDLAANSGLGFVSGDLTMGTPGTLSVSSTSVLSGSNHAHAVTASSDVSAGTAALLKSTAAGGLGLASAFTTGAVDVGQGFTSGNNTIRMIYHTHDYPHTHMVVNPTGLWSLDEQFGLDVDDNLLVRGWIVGKHAIQIDGAKMLVHYDGQPPVETNFTGNATGHMGQVGVKTGGITFREGKFGKAVATGESTTNLITNPSFETNLTSWSAIGTAALARIFGSGTAGDYAMRIAIASGSDNYASYQSLSLTAATAYTVSMMVRPTTTAANSISIRVIRVSDGSVTANLVYAPVALNEWEYKSFTFTAPATTTYHLRVGYPGANVGNIQVDEVQVEQKAYPTPYCDGSLGTTIPGVTNGFAWTGTAHASTSTRTIAYVTYDDASLDDFGQPMTVMAWIKPFANTGSIQAILSKENTGNTEGWEFVLSSLNLRVRLRNPDTDLDTGAPVTIGAWNFIAFSWGQSTLTVYLNGVEVGSTTGTSDVISTNDFLVGRRASANTSFNGLIDEVSLVSRVMSDDEIRAVYESNAPVFAETSTWHFRAGRNRVYADSEGLWAYGASGAPILGLYAGEDNNLSATKSWGGLSLSEGDLLLGRHGASDGGWMLFDQDLVGGDPAWIFGHGDDEVLRLDSGGASLTGVLDIDSSGGIYQGTGTFALPDTGLKIWTDSSTGIGRIAGYGGGIVQWTADSGGRLVAAANRFRVDQNGLWVDDGTGTTTGAVFGVMARASTSVAWGSMTLSTGDILIGNDTDGYLLWDNSASTKLSLKGADFDVGSGTIIAGSGDVTLDASGLWLSSTVAGALGVISETKAVTWEYSGAVIGTIGAQRGATGYTTRNTLLVQSDDGGGLSNSNVVLSALGSSSVTTLLVDSASGVTISGANDGVLTVGGRGSFGKPLLIQQQSGTGAEAALSLLQSDLSEEYIYFQGAAAASNPYSNAALGAYRGKVRVRTADGLKWMPIYD